MGNEWGQFSGKLKGQLLGNQQLYSQKIDITASKNYVISNYALKTGWFAYQASSYAFSGIYNASQYVMDYLKS